MSIAFRSGFRDGFNAAFTLMRELNDSQFVDLTPRSSETAAAGWAMTGKIIRRAGEDWISKEGRPQGGRSRRIKSARP